MLGAYPKASRPITALNRLGTTTQVLAVLAAAGVGAMAGTLQGNGRMVLSAAGTNSLLGVVEAPTSFALSAAGAGAFAPVMRAEVSSILNAQGSSTFNVGELTSRPGVFAGTSSFAAVSYAFFLDGERACVHQELRTAEVLTENRTAIVPFEDRVYRAAAEPREAGNQPRKRIC